MAGITGLPNVQGLMAQKAAEAQAKAAAAAQAKAAYDAIPYSQHLAEARAAVTSAQQAAQQAWDAKQASSATGIKTAAFPKGIPDFSKLALKRDPAVLAAQKNVSNLVTNHLRDQLKAQGKQYGYGWKGNKNEDFHSGNVANLLSGQGITDLSQVGYSKDGKYLMNKETGKNLNWYKDNYTNKKGRGQLGWSAKGKGRTNYYVQRNAQGEPVFYPQWKSSGPKGIGGFLLKAAPAIAGMIGGPGAAAATSGVIGLASGNKFGDVLKNAALNYATTYAGGKFSNLANANLPMVGNAGITNAIADAAGGAAAGGIRGIATGQNPLTSAAMAAAASGIGSGINYLTGQIPNTGNATLDKWLQSGAGAGLNYLINPQIAGLFNGSGGANTSGGTNQTRGGTTQNQAGNTQNQGGVNGLQGGNANTNALLAGLMLGGINQPQAGQQQVRYQMGDAPKLSFA